MKATVRRSIAVSAQAYNVNAAFRAVVNAAANDLDAQGDTRVQGLPKLAIAKKGTSKWSTQFSVRLDYRTEADE